MRTTLRLDDDVLLAVRARARREKRTAGEVLSELARQALTASPGPRPQEDGTGFFGFEPLPPRGGAVTNSLVDELREDAQEG